MPSFARVLVCLVLLAGSARGASNPTPLVEPVGSTSAVRTATGSSRNDAVDLEPLYGGPRVTTLIVADNNLNTESPTQTIPLVGNSTGTGNVLPSVSSVSPGAGNTPVLITGMNLAGATSVQFGSVPAASFTVNSATSIGAVSPAGTPTVDVTVTTPDGTSAIAPNDQFTYVVTTQSIAFTQSPNAFAGTSALLRATGGPSGSPIVFSIVSGPATLSGPNGSTITYTGPGSVTIQADQAGGNGYPAALPVQVTTAVTVQTVPVSFTSAPEPTVVTFTQAGTLAGIRTSTLGAANGDFALSTGNSCTIGTAYAVGDTCSVNFSFQPTRPGLRNGGITFTSASGHVLANSYIYGLGTGPQVIFNPGSQSVLGSNFAQPSGIAVNGNGDIFVSTYAGGLQEIPANEPIRTLGSFDSCDDVAVDGSGNVFVICDRTTLSEVLAVAGEIPQNPTVVTLVGTFKALNGMKVDGNGNVYLASSDRSGGNAAIYEVPAVDGSIPTSPSVLTLTTAVHGATGVALDANGDLFVSDELTGAVDEFIAVDGAIPANAAPVTLASGFSQLSNIALDAAGDVFVTDASGAVQEIVAVGGSIPASQPVILTLGTGWKQPDGLAIEPNGDVLVADAGFTQAIRLDLSDPPALNFAQTAVGQTSSDSPQTVTFRNDGNAPLAFSALPSAVNPSITLGFTLTGGTCPRVPAGFNPGSLAEGASCTDLVSFTPSAPGPYTGPLVETDNTLNQTGATQTVPLNGNAIPPLTITLTATPGAVFVGAPVTLTASIAASGPALTGSVTFLDGTQPLGSVVPQGSNATLVVSTLSVGVHTITAVYSGDSFYGTVVSASVQVTVQDFALSTTASNVIIDHGGTATVQLNLTPIGGLTMPAAISLAVSGYPVGSTVTFTPSSVASGSGPTPITLIIQTPNYPTADVAAPARLRGPGAPELVGLPLAVCCLVFVFRRRRSRLARLHLTLLLLAAAMASVSLSGCGWGWKTQTWTVSVTAQSGQLTHSVSFLLTSECKNGQPACQITSVSGN
jgi:hypothetical protein